MQNFSVAVVGSGPAALMAADCLAAAGVAVRIYDKRPGPAWKLYIAGGSGLNISNKLPLESFASHYTGPEDLWRQMLGDFFSGDWIRFIEQQLQLGTFLGTSGRYFVETMHAAKLIRNWKRRLEGLGVRFHLQEDCLDFQQDGDAYQLRFRNGESTVHSDSADAIIFALGGGSYEKDALEWPNFFEGKGISFQPFEASNTGYEVAWPAAFLAEAEGQALKNICLMNSRGERRGDMIITAYGLEGTPIYFLGQAGSAWIDLKPDLSPDAIRQKMQRSKERLSPLRCAQKYLQLSPPVQALLFHKAPAGSLSSVDGLVAVLKRFPIELLTPRPMSESISTKGGIRWENLDDTLMLKAFPKVYLAGEMIDWDAPTGGFLIQGSVAQGFRAAQGLLKVLKLILEDGG